MLRQKRNKICIPFDLILRGAILAKISYSDPLEFEHNLKEIYSENNIEDHTTTIVNDIIANREFHDASKHSDENTQLYLHHHGDDYYCVFRGTSESEDIWADLDIVRTDIGDDSNVHRGFLEQFMAIEKYLTAILSQVPMKATVYIIGHSLGGALATIAAYYYSYINSLRSHIVCLSYGSPRVGDLRFGENFKVNGWRVYHHSDPVPLIPLSRHYYHPKSNALCLRTNGDYDKRRRLRRPYGGFFVVELRHPFNNHKLTQYIQLLASCYESNK